MPRCPQITLLDPDEDLPLRAARPSECHVAIVSPDESSEELRTRRSVTRLHSGPLQSPISAVSQTDKASFPQFLMTQPTQDNSNDDFVITIDFNKWAEAWLRAVLSREPPEGQAPSLDVRELGSLLHAAFDRDVPDAFISAEPAWSRSAATEEVSK